MKWNELQEKAKVKLMCDLRVVDASKVTAYAYLTPGQLDEVAPIARKAGSVFTVYPAEENVSADTELYNEETDETMYFDPLSAVPAHFQVI